MPQISFGQGITPVHAIVDALVETALQHRRDGRPVPAIWYADRIKGFELSAAQERAVVFHLIQRVPYQITRWRNDPDTLFFGWRGDCRHKAAAQARMFQRVGTTTRFVKVRFDWADLPIPSDILSELPDTRSIHDAVAIGIAGQWVSVDATWDPVLARRGFPSVKDWDGLTATPPVTNGSIDLVFSDEIPSGISPYMHLNVPWPELARTQAFNRRLNPWLVQQRSLVAEQGTSL